MAAGTKRVRAASLFINARKQATLQGCTYTLNTNDTQEVADGGVFVAEGRPLTTVQANTIIPVAGSTTKIHKKALAKEELELVLWPIDGDVVTLKGARVATYEVASETASGRQNGNFQFFAATPDIKG